MTIVRVRPWYTEEDKAKLVSWAEKIARGSEIESIIVRENVWNEDFVQVQFKTQTERQKQFGFFDLTTRRKLLSKLPKKYQPHTIIEGYAK